jgi:hypothetical protein
VRRGRPRGFSLVEATLCTLLVGILFTAAVQAVGLSGTIQLKSADRARGRALAHALLDEVVQQKYSSASPPPASSFDLILGATAGPRAADRTGFEDVDDYRGYADAPPLNRDGSAIPGSASFARRVTVAYVNPMNLTQSAATDTGVKRVTVVVTRNGQTVARATALRCDVP